MMVRIKINIEQLVVLVGKKGISGFTDGDVINVLFNKPNSVVNLNNSNKKLDSNNYKPIYLNTLSNNRPSLSCIYATSQNYTSCENTTIPSLINITNYNLVNSNSKGLFLERKNVKFIYFSDEEINKINSNYMNNTNNNTNITNENDKSNSESSSMNKTFNYFFIADTNNHCIRKVDMITAEVSTFAGQCTQKGFKDGPLGINRLNYPENIGIDNEGNIYINDTGNKYMRIVDTNGYMKTLINGACFEYENVFNPNNFFKYSTKYILCFKSWIKTYGLPLEHIYDEIKDQSVCKLHASLCNFKSHLIYNRTLTLFNSHEIYKFTPEEILTRLKNKLSSSGK